MKNRKGIVNFNTPPDKVIMERQELNRQKMADLKSPRQPLGGAPEVKIPPLNAEPLEGGGSMANQAEALRDPTNPMSPSYNPQLAEMAKKGLLGPQPTVRAPGQAFRTLPPEAQQDPRFRPGVGSMIAANQPHLQGQMPMTTETDGYKPKLSNESIASMKALEEFQLQAQNNQKKLPEKEAERVERDVSEEDKFVGELKDILGDDAIFDKMNNPERKKRIESALDPMEFTDIIMHGEVRQDVPIRKGLTLTFRTASGAEDLAVKRLMYTESGSDRYMLDKYSIMQLTLALVGINGQPLLSHMTEDKKFDEEKYTKKFEKVIQFPIEFIAEAGLQYLWFHERVRDLFNDETEQLKNG